MNIEELMTRTIATCQPMDNLAIAAAKLWDVDCGALPVVARDGTLIGILTDRDICMSAWTRGDLLTNVRVEQAMSKQVFTVTADHDVTAVERLMIEKQVRRIPVVDAENRPVGIVSLNDLACEAARPDTRLKDGFARVARTLAAVCQPRKRTTQAA